MPEVVRSYREFEERYLPRAVAERHPETDEEIGARWAREALAELKAARNAEAALYHFLDALVLARKNDDVMSVVDAMLETYVAGQVSAEVAEIHAATNQPTEPT